MMMMIARKSLNLRKKPNLMTNLFGCVTGLGLMQPVSQLLFEQETIPDCHTHLWICLSLNQYHPLT